MSGAALSIEEEKMQRFRERLSKIEKKGKKIEYAPVGAVEFDDKGKAFVASVPTLTAVRGRRFFRKVLTAPFVLAMAFAIGAAVVVGVRLGRVAYDGGALTGDGAGPAMLMDAGLALAVVLVLRVLFKLRGRRMLLGQLVGIMAGVVAMHDLVHVAPSVWQAVFPQAWVSQVLATTEPNSILIKGVSYML